MKILQTNQPARTPLVLLFAAIALLLVSATAPAAEPGPEKPLMRDFIGLNVHTVKFKPELYAPVCRRLRDYHPIDWDAGADMSKATSFPLAANRVDWGKMYGAWTKHEFAIDACLMFDGVAPAKWKDPARDAKAYGQAFASFFGPSGHGLVSSVEVGNEPSKYSEAEYRTIFEAMSAGIRAGDPKLPIVTCAVMTGKPDKWSKPMSAIEGLEKSYDVLNIHSYPFKEKYPTWRRSYPEDTSIRFLQEVQALIAWRDAHAPGKPVWITEFGYDSSTKPAPKTGTFSKWEGVTDEQQAQYIVRAFLVLSAMKLDRAYLYFFNDDDKPELHGASGITRGFAPKPSFYAMSHLSKTLGDYRLSHVLTSEPGLYCYEYAQPAPSNEHIVVAWSPTGGAGTKATLPRLTKSLHIYKAEQMPLTADAPTAAKWTEGAAGIEVEVGPTPVFLWVK